jgi:hypothetical protein
MKININTETTGSIWSNTTTNPTAKLDIPKPFPEIGVAVLDLSYNLKGINTEQFKAIYNYFAQFGVREVFPEVGKEYKFSYDGENWIKDIFESYESNNSIGFTHIRPIQPTRLEQLKARRSELNREELLELVELMEGKDD